MNGMITWRAMQGQMQYNEGPCKDTWLQSETTLISITYKQYKSDMEYGDVILDHKGSYILLK